MQKLILESKFLNNNEVEVDYFWSELYKINTDDVTEKDILDSISALSEQIPKYNPEYNSDSSSMIIRCAEVISEMIKENSTDKIYDSLTELIKLVIKCSWTATNSDILQKIGHAFRNNYFESLSDEKLKKHVSIFETLTLMIPVTEASENYSNIRCAQKEFLMQMFVDNFQEDIIKQFKEIFQTFLRTLFFKSWTTSEEEAEIYSYMAYQSEAKLEKLYAPVPDKFVTFFCEISEKLIHEDIQTKGGQEMIQQFYESSCSILKHKKENVEIMMDKWLKALFNLSKVDQNSIFPIQKILSEQLQWLNKKYLGTAFKNCQTLINDAMEYLLFLIERYPTNCEDDMKETMTSDWENLVKAMTEVFFQYTLQTPENLEIFIPCLERLISLNNKNGVNLFVNSFKRIEKPLQNLFKKKPNLLVPLIDKAADAAINASETEDHDQPFPLNYPEVDYSDVYDHLTKFGKLPNVFSSESLQECLRLNFLKVFNQYSISSSVFIDGFQEYLTFKNYTPDQMNQFIESINLVIDNPVFLIFNPKVFAMGSLVNNVVKYISEYPSEFSSSFPQLIQTCKLCLKGDLQWEDCSGEMSLNANSMMIFNIFQQLLVTKPATEYLTELYSLAFEAIDMTDESHSYFSAFISCTSMVPRQCSSLETLIPFIPHIIKCVKKIDKTSLAACIATFLDGLQLIITSKPSEAVKYLNDIEDVITRIMNNSISVVILQLLTVIYEEFPEKINEKFIQKVNKKMPEDNGNAYFYSMLYKAISKTRPQFFKNLFPQIAKSLEDYKSLIVNSTLETLTNILTYDPTCGEKIFSLIEKLIKNNKDDNAFCMLLLYGLRPVGLLRHDLLVKYKEKIEGWQKYSASYHDVCQHLLDVIADRSLAQLDHNISQHGKEIERLDNEMESQKEQVDVINKEVNQQKADLEDINKRVDESEVQIDTLKQDVKEISEQVEEIDLKTVSSAPKWAREVSKLLNPPSDDDWKLLAQRLGYNTEDIRGWSTHSDPCMSLLSDWFAVRRNVEATRAILEQLVEMNRNDAARIVEDALTVAEAMISDDEPIEFITPPLIFLSYQWSNQEDVKILREHLQKAGYRCWMDIGQMGGGDKLYEAIDRGIRGAKVFVCCVSKKYSESPNCKRELNLAISLHKSVIPLQMEKMDWPPVGTMGPLLTEYIFIRMFARPGAEVISGTFWPYDRFQELLMQIRYSCAPEYELVDESYLNWWVPPENKTKKANLTDMQIPQPDEQENEIIENPQIFISYQWGKQEEVKKLKSTLTKLGYSCWMDVYQMGGGDSLYDKIDRGLRGCKLMISCVTPKYSESPNCRREVSLCDGLKKPIIAIMLERMTWPPEGPMSMILSPLSYISFVDSFEEQQNWNGIVTSELLCRIKSILSESICDVDVAIKKEVNEVSKVSCSKQDFVKARNSIDKVNQRSKETLHAVSGAPKSKSCIII